LYQNLYVQFRKNAVFFSIIYDKKYQYFSVPYLFQLDSTSLKWNEVEYAYIRVFIPVQYVSVQFIPVHSSPLLSSVLWSRVFQSSPFQCILVYYYQVYFSLLCFSLVQSSLFHTILLIQTSSGGFVNDPLKILVYTSHISSAQDGLEVSRLALSLSISLSSFHPSTTMPSWQFYGSKDFRHSW